jgi:hypothetical protein
LLSVSSATGLEQATDGLAAGSGVVVGLELVQGIPVDEILAGEKDGGNLLLLDEAAKALGMDAEDPGGLDQVKVVLEWSSDHPSMILVSG